MYSVWKEDKIKLVTWGMLMLLLLFCCVSMYYSDLWETYHDSLGFLDCLMSGRLLEFYELKGVLYFIPVYIIFGIWLLPVWIAVHFFQADSGSMACLIWSKGIILVFAAGCIWRLYGILKKLKYSDLEYSVFLFVSSLLFVFPSMVIVQYDVIELFFLLCAVYYYMKDEKLSWKSLLFFSIAVSVKLFALFILLLVVLVIEKKILYIVRDMLAGVSFTVITMLPFLNRGYWNGAGGRNIGFAYSLLTATIPGGLSSISIFLSGYFVLCAIAYFSKKKDIEHNLKLIIWLSSAFFLLLFVFVSCHPYWIVLCLPFLVMVITEHDQNLKINILIETVLEVIIILMQGIAYNWVYFSGRLVDALLFKKLGIESNLTANIVTFLDISEGGTALCMILASTVFAVGGGVLLVVNNPWKPVLCEDVRKELVMEKKISRIARVGAVAFLLGLTLVIVF